MFRSGQLHVTSTVPPEKVESYQVKYPNNINIDPYDNYQKPNSHGFCQLFSYYIFIGETDNLKIARRTTALSDYANNIIQVINNIKRCN